MATPSTQLIFTSEIACVCSGVELLVVIYYHVLLPLNSPPASRAFTSEIVEGVGGVDAPGVTRVLRAVLRQVLHLERFEVQGLEFLGAVLRQVLDLERKSPICHL